LRIPSLDGIRGLAALIVFGGHAGLDNVLPAGFGVTIFFFLSGFLITTLLRQEYERTGDISLKKFYLRRIYRILPPLYIVLLLFLMPWSLRGQGAYFHPTTGAVLLQFMQLTNYYLILGDAAHLVPSTNPTWSLAIEEHFYLLFPLALLLLRRHHDYRRIGLLFALTCAAVLLWRCILVLGLHVSSDYTYYATDARIDSLLFGCIMGVALNPVLDRCFTRLTDAQWMGALVLAAALLGFTFLYRSEVFRQTLRYSIQGVALLPIFFCAVRHPRWWLFGWLQSPVMRALGLISYTFYLVHSKAIALSRAYSDSGLLRGLLALAMTIAFASAMYYLVERHLGALRRRLHASALAVRPAMPAAASGPANRPATQTDLNR